MKLGDRFTRRRSYFLIAAAVMALDQATKILAHRYLRGGGAVEIVPGFFNLWYSRNAGGLFGMFREWDDPWRTLLLTLLPVAAILLITRFLLLAPDDERATLAGLGLILGGAIGNLIDRALRGEVVDFLDAYVSHPALRERLERWFGTAHWPTFNVADSAIVVGAGLLLLHLARAPRAAPGARRE
jgi:signal peptidase II